MRLFIAFSVTKEAKAAFIKVQREMAAASRGAPVKWTDEDQCHVTLEFLGEVAEDRVAELSALIEQSVYGFKPFNFSFAGTDAFPNWLNPNVLTMRLKFEDEAERLKSELHQLLKQNKFINDDRPWKPHLTLGRIKGKYHGILSLRDIEVPRVSWTADRVELIESRLKAEGPEYVLVKDFCLR